MLHRITVLLFVTLLTICSCDSNEDLPDVDHIEVSLQSRRLDVDLLHVDTSNLVEGMKLLSLKYPDFLGFYLDTLLGFGVQNKYTPVNEALTVGVKEFLTHKDYRGLLDTIMLHFPDVRKQDAQLTRSFQYLKYYFPQVTIPKVIYFSSGLNNWGALTYGDVQGIGLDMFLGKEYKYYASVGLAPYLYTKFVPDYIPVAVMCTQYDLIAPFEYEHQNLLHLMIQKGKQQYFLEKTVPYLPAYQRMGFTEAQWEWCEEYEKDIYSFFIQGKLLYETNLQKIMRYVLDGPTSTGMPNSPGNVGTWLGYRIVKSYMQRHPETKLEELVQPFKAEEFLRESGYKP